jgi:hypothetical protein
MHDFDLVTFFYAYHDITYLGVDRAKMNKALYDALKPGGELGRLLGQGRRGHERRPDSAPFG